MNEIIDIISNAIIEHILYILLAIMYGVHKAIDVIEERELKFTLLNIIKFAIIYSIAAPFKIGKDIGSKSKHKIKKLKQ